LVPALLAVSAFSWSPNGSAAAASRSVIRSPAAYYRPIVAGGRAFPLARSNYISLIQILSNWHAPRLRLIGGRWVLVGVHEGIDIVAEPGTPVLTMEPGVVENLGWTFYSGTRVGVRGGDGRYYLYAHLSAIQSGLSIGNSVAAGSRLGLVGNTGYGPPGHRDEFPPHLHFGIEEGTEWVDPYGTLLSLYRATVGAQERGQVRLDKLAASGDRSAWAAAGRALYMLPGPGPGE
jgi:murein DD-endopeptidase MepM/ murein hydrolase activator NlpD